MGAWVGVPDGGWGGWGSDMFNLEKNQINQGFEGTWGQNPCFQGVDG
jgi:hypothetical protein